MHYSRLASLLLAIGAARSWGCARDAVALRVDIDTVRSAGWLPVQLHAEWQVGAGIRRPHDEVHVARMKTIGEASARSIERRGVCVDRPST